MILILLLRISFYGHKAVRSMESALQYVHIHFQRFQK